MLKKTFLTIIIFNLIFIAWQSILGISLSTQGDILNDRLLAIQEIQNQIDLLDNQIVYQGNLEKISIIANQKGFVPAKIIRYSSESLADAKLK